jgi:6-phosphofructokinase 1
MLSGIQDLIVEHAAGLQDMIAKVGAGETDASGNPILQDIGGYLTKSLKQHFKEIKKPVDLKYIDPTYMIRAIPTIPNDRIYCNVLGQNSVHAAFSGITGVLHVPDFARFPEFRCANP